MRVFKPLQLSLQHKTFNWQKKNQLSVSLLLGFPFDNNREMLLEQDLWKLLAEQLDGEVLDACMPKVQGEVLVYGNYHAPGGHPVTADRVRLKMGSVDKSLAIIGDRYWRTLLAPTEPEPFTEMPIRYDRAFGGEAHKANPIGKGLQEVDYFGEARLPMPNIENPDWLMTSRDARPDPAGFGPLDMMWEPRLSRLGTYDDTWLQEYFPGYPPDIDWTHFNTAPPDQWINEFWQGGEAFQITNMHTEKTQVRGNLPTFRARCFVEKQAGSGTLFSELEMRSETVCLFPAIETGVMIYRGVIEIAEDDAADVDHLLAAYEDLQQAPRPKEYYEAALHNRLDEKKTFKYMMYTSDIIPDSERCGFARMMDSIDSGGESEFANNMAAKAEAEKQQAMDLLEQQKQQLKKQLEAADIDPAPYLKKFESQDAPTDDAHVKAIKETMEKILPGSSSGNVKDIKVADVDFSQFDELSKQMDAMAEAKKNQVRQQLEDAVKKVEGTEQENALRQQVDKALKQMDELPDLPRPQPDETLQQLKTQLQQLEEAKDKLRTQGVQEAQLPQADISLDEVEQKLRDGIAAMADMYRQGAHYIEGAPPHQQPIDIIRYRFLKSVDKGESLAGKDLAGVDLSGLDLSGLDLSDCFLEYSNLSGTKLCATNLQRAIITHANLTNANLTDADLRGSNLGDSNLQNANLTRARLKDSEFSKSDLSQAKVIDCDIENINFLETRMAAIDLSNSRLKAADFLEIDFSGSRFVDANMQECNFVQCVLQHADFSHADLTGSIFVECELDHSHFVKATMTNVRFPMGCSIQDCNFDYANLDQANLRDTEASGSRFEFSSFRQADFSGANMQNCKFYGADGKRALLIKTDLGNADFSSVNLMEGSLLKARLTNANLSHSNFYAVEFLNATVGDTELSGANLDLTKLEQWRP